MKKILRPAGALLLCSALFTPAAHAYLTVAGNGTIQTATNGTTFVTTPTAAIFYKPTGDYYFGLSTTIAVPGNYAICYGNYRTPDVAPTLTAIGSNVAITNLNIGNIAVVPYSVDLTIPTVLSTVGNPQTTAILTAITKAYNTNVVQTAALLDTAGAASAGIRGLCASNDTGTLGLNIAFAATKVTAGVSTPFGAGVGATDGTNTDGLMGILMGRTAATGAPVFTYLGGNALNSRAFDLTSTGSYFIGDDAGVLICTVGLAGTRYGDYPAMWYDSILGRLYVGTTIRTATPGAAGAVSTIVTVGIYPVTKTDTTIAIGAQLKPFSNAAGTNPLVNLASFDATAIVAMKSTNAEGAIAGSAQMIRTMHTSTGRVYLLVNGSVSSQASAANIAAVSGNRIYALPLVGTNAITANGVAAADAIGCFADVNTEDYATIAGNDATSFMLTGSIACLVGGNGVLPITAAANVVSDMYVDGDAVYVATGFAAGAATGLNETGVWKSQAIFDNFGKIDHWTDWQKVIPGQMGGNTAGGTAADGTDGRVDFVAVDGYTGHIWATNLTSLKSNVTQWSQPTVLTAQSGLPAAVNAALPSGLCYSVLDLNSSVTGWGGNTSARITMFGGQEKVCFAVTGSATSPTDADSNAGFNGTLNRACQSLNTIAGGVYDYTNSQTFLTTTLPTGAGAVISLGYSGWSQNATNPATPGFFFAGCAGTASTAPGLYVWTLTGATATLSVGFDSVGAYSSLVQAPFGGTNAYGWQRVSNVQGMPVKIQSIGGGVHVLTRTATLDRIYSCPAQANLNGLNTTFVVTASSGVTPAAAGLSDLSAVSKIYDFVISVSATAAAATPATATEQLLMLTNDGIYTTSAANGMQDYVNQLTQLNAGWVQIAAPTTEGFLSDYIAQPDYNRNPETFWYGNWAANPNGTGVYNQYIWYQMSRFSWTSSAAAAVALSNATNYTADPTTTATFNAATSFAQSTAPTLYATFPVNSRLLYNDGCRRFFVQKNPANDGAYQVLVLPYNLADYNITANGKAPMSDTVVAQAGAFYWMATAGDSGRLMMGTSNGVIALQ